MLFATTGSTRALQQRTSPYFIRVRFRYKNSRTLRLMVAGIIFGIALCKRQIDYVIYVSKVKGEDRKKPSWSEP